MPGVIRPAGLFHFHGESGKKIGPANPESFGNPIQGAQTARPRTLDIIERLASDPRLVGKGRHIVTLDLHRILNFCPDMIFGVHGFKL